jgi:hypothetical protein
MSKNEDIIENLFIENGFAYKKQVSVPIENFPWKTERTKHSPRVDFYLEATNIYIEVKGFMTIEAMSKMAFLCKQDFPYYIFQVTEKDWLGLSEKDSINYQFSELMNTENKTDLSSISYARLKQFIGKKAEIYQSWVGDSLL